MSINNSECLALVSAQQWSKVAVYLSNTLSTEQLQDLPR